MKLAIFGGTFDPLHRGHLEIARGAADTFGLDQVLFIPSGQPPHRSHPPVATYEHRYRMVELACTADERFVASRLEAPAHGGPHYSVDTVARVRHDCTPLDELYFLIGADAFAEVTQWRHWQELAEMVEFIVVSRPGEDIQRQTVPAPARTRWLTTVHVPISSTQIRDMLRGGIDAREWLSPEVAAYVEEKGLYQRTDP